MQSVSNEDSLLYIDRFFFQWNGLNDEAVQDILHIAGKCDIFEGKAKMCPSSEYL